jgi:hypothetical protein
MIQHIIEALNVNLHHPATAVAYERVSEHSGPLRKIGAGARRMQFGLRVELRDGLK